jgi:uncharacterized protein (DUF2236 family)
MSIIAHTKMNALNPKWIQGVTESPKFRRGALGRKAAKAHMKTKEFMSHVLADPEDYDERTRKQANFMRTLLSFKHGK